MTDEQAREHLEALTFALLQARNSAQMLADGGKPMLGVYHEDIMWLIRDTHLAAIKMKVNRLTRREQLGLGPIRD